MAWLSKLRWPIALLVIGLGVLTPLFITVYAEPADVSDPVVFSEYRADFAVAADGTLDATETITAEFPLWRHGLFRYWDIANPNDPDIRQPPDITEITLDGAPVPFELSWEDNRRFRVAKIGDPARYLDEGTHVFTIRYRIAGVLDPGGTGAEKSFPGSEGRPSDARSVFYWNVIPPGWNNPITEARISVTLPGPLTGAQCALGAGVGAPCGDMRIDGRTVEVTARAVPPRTPLSVRIGVDVATPPRPTVPWSQKWDAVLGSAPVWLIAAGVTAVAGLVAAMVLMRTTAESPPGFGVHYTPPEGLGPVQNEYIRTEAVPKHGLTATVFHLAEHGLLTLDQTEPKKWVIRSAGTARDWRAVDPVGAAVATALGVRKPGREFRADGTVSAGATLERATAKMGQAVRQWALDAGLVVRKRDEWWVRVANGVALVLAIAALFRLFGGTVWIVPFGLFFVATMNAWKPGVGLRRTAAGRELWSQAGGFHRLVATDSAESRFDFAARSDLYTAYIPFAVAAGSAALWAKKYQAATGTPAPSPGWYHVAGAHGALSGSSAGFDSFESALSSSIGAYTSSQSSSGGGGGGGGGGGSW